MKLLLNETFDRDALDPRLTWLHPPSKWRLDRGRSRLVIEPDAQTDFWQRTHYGFRRDTGHFLYCPAPHNAVITAKFHCFAAHQYDQAGLMVRFSQDCWLKASVEFEPDTASQLGAVVTNHGYSDWSLQDFPSAAARDNLSYCLRVRLQGPGAGGCDVLVEHAVAEDGPWSLLRVAHLHAPADAAATCGIYACSPQAAGYRVDVEFLTVAFE